MNDEPYLSEQTKAEMEAGRKQLAINQANMERARLAREAEENAAHAAEKAPDEDKEMADATAEAEAQAIAQGKGRGFPRAAKPYQPGSKE